MFKCLWLLNNEGCIMNDDIKIDNNRLFEWFMWIKVIIKE